MTDEEKLAYILEYEGLNAYQIALASELADAFAAVNGVLAKYDDIDAGQTEIFLHVVRTGRFAGTPGDNPQLSFSPGGNARFDVGITKRVQLGSSDEDYGASEASPSSAPLPPDTPR